MTWVPGCIHEPGRNAGYRSGRCSMQLAVDHFTVGRDSRALIRDQGLAAFLLPKVGPAYQFAECDSRTAHACEWNGHGPGLEFERLNWDEPLTPDQIHWGGVISRHLNAMYGIPLVHHGGARLPLGDAFRGFVNHGSLVHRACDQHTDGITDADFHAMVGAAVPAAGGGYNDMWICFFKQADGRTGTYLCAGAVIIAQWISTPEIAGAYGISRHALAWMEGYQKENGKPVERTTHGMQTVNNLKAATKAAGITLA